MSTARIELTKSLEYSPSWNSPVLLGVKRAIDISVAALLLLLLLPFFLILALAIKVTSPGPVFYRWHVVGRGGRPFVGYKFRSMCKNADELKGKLCALNEMHGPVFKATNDPRITKLGSWMRRYSIDELPQLYSVVKGDMSLVGPRPPLLTEYLQFNAHQKLKVAVKPGITCLWQVSGRNSVKDFDDWVRLDLEYIRTWTPKLDFSILIRTGREIFAGSGK